MSVAPVAAIAAAPSPALAAPPALGGPAGMGFARMLVDGIQGVNDKAIVADRTVRAFVLDDAIPVHQVSFALEESRLSLELMLQVRSRLVEGYQQLMTMQM